METLEVKVKTDIKPVTDEMKIFRKEIQQLRSQLINLDEESEEYSKTLSELADKQFKLREINEDVRYTVTDLGEKIATVTRIGQGFIAGFSAVQGVIHLFGTESENLQKTMVKLQAAMAIVQGLQGLEGLGKDIKCASIQFASLGTSVKTFIKSLTGVKAAIASTGIGIFIIAIGTLIANWDKLLERFNNTKPIKDANAAIDKLNTSLKEIDSIKLQNDTIALETYLKLLRNAGNDVNKIAEAKRIYEEVWNNRLIDSNLKRQVSAAKTAVEETKKAFESLSIYEQQDENNEVVKAYNEAKDKLQAAELAFTQFQVKEEEKRTAAVIAENEKRLAAQKAENEKRLAEQKAAEEKAEAEQKAAEENALSIKEHNIDRWVELEKRKLDKQKQINEESLTDTELDNNGDGWITPEELTTYQTFLDTKQSLFAAEINAENTIIDTQILKLQELADAQAAAGMDNTGTVESIEDLKAQLEDNNAAILKNEKDTLKAKEKANDEYRKNQQKREKMIADFKIQTASNVLGSLSSIIGEETAAGKVAAIAQATIDTYAAANGAYKAMSWIPGVGPALGAAAAAAAVIAGIANVKRIAAVNTTAENSNIATDIPNTTATILPTDIYGTQLSDSNEYDLQNQQKDLKVYVLESDITEKQNDIKVQVKESTF